MTIKDMTDLVYIYDGLSEMEKAIYAITGQDNIFMYDEGAMGKISRVFDVIKRNTSLYDPERDEDVEKSEFAKVLDDKSLSPEDRAKVLSGI